MSVSMGTCTIASERELTHMAGAKTEGHWSEVGCRARAKSREPEREREQRVI